MKGVIFNLIEEVVAEAFGADAWDAMLDSAGLDGAYTSLGSYPDAELTGLVRAGAELTGTPADALVRDIGRLAIPRLEARYPQFFAGAGDARAFILALNTIIHPEVRKLYSGAHCPHFHFATQGRSLLLGYDSPRRLCHLAHGFIDGLALRYDEQITVSQPRCMHRGDAMCQLQIDWA